MITILDPGLQATIQDLGRPHYGHLGVPVAGAADRTSLILANRLVGNSDSAAAVEILLGRISARFDGNALIALTGAPVAAQLDGVDIPFGTLIPVGCGQILKTRAARQGLRTYLAVAGGIDVQAVLGSRSTDTLSGMGPPALAAGTSLPVGAPTLRASVDLELSATVLPGPLHIAVRLGPRDDVFPEEAIDALRSAEWQISHETDRIGARLSGPALLPRNGSTLPTEGLTLGSIQVPPSGQPILHLANHPPTGGYPVIAVVDDAYIDIVAQARPGTALRFTLLPRVTF